jgi:hypothetical protein
MRVGLPALRVCSNWLCCVHDRQRAPLIATGVSRTQSPALTGVSGGNDAEHVRTGRPARGRRPARVRRGTGRAQRRELRLRLVQIGHQELQVVLQRRVGIGRRAADSPASAGKDRSIVALSASETQSAQE